MYLVEKGRLLVEAGGKRVDSQELWKYALSALPRFRELYDVYKDLRERGFVVRRGLKFGCDYLAYRYGPGIDHAPYGVHVFRVDESFDPIELVRMGRLLHSVRKKLVIALHNGKNITYILLSWWKP